MREIGVGLLGLGNVGAGVVRILEENAVAIEARLGARLVVRTAAVRDLGKQRLVSVDAKLLTTDPESVVANPDVEIVCELIGGETYARRLVLQAIEAGKQVVTANKALLAIHGDELYAKADNAGVDLYFEAAVCGGIPVIRTLREGLASDRIEWIIGIVNGTSNFITSQMAQGGKGFAEVLAAAQEAGFAEADPTLDIGGGDAAHKLAILAMLSFQGRVNLDDIHVEGIESLTTLDYKMAKHFGYVIKPLAIARNHQDGVELRCHPALVPSGWLLADVPDANNALYVHSFALGASMYYGAGAGMMPTAMSVVSDLIEVARNIAASATAAVPLYNQRDLSVRPMSKLETAYYLRVSVADRPGVLGQLTTILGHHDVSIAELLQTRQSATPGESKPVPVSVVALTHVANEGKMQAALKGVMEAGLTLSSPVLLRIADMSQT